MHTVTKFVDNPWRWYEAGVLDRTIQRVDIPFMPVCRDGHGFVGFKELCPYVPQNSVRDAKYPGFLQVIKMHL
jgi:hypothetical protein